MVIGKKMAVVSIFKLSVFQQIKKNWVILFMSMQERPLSPHLQVYRPQWTSVLSISHRLTGVLLSVGLIPLVVWLVALGSGPDAFSSVQAFYSQPLMTIAWVAWTFALFYHLCNGVRHLFWDAGYLLDLKGAFVSGMTVVVVAITLTVISWGVWL